MYTYTFMLSISSIDGQKQAVLKSVVYKFICRWKNAKTSCVIVRITQVKGKDNEQCSIS